MESKFIVGEFFTEEFLKGKLFPNGVVLNELFVNKLIAPNKEMVVKINKNLGKLRTCNILEPLNDSDTQKYTGSAPLSEKGLLQILYLLICDFDDRSKQCLEVLGTRYHYNAPYHFQVELSSGEFLGISLYRFGPFYLTAHKFDSGVSSGMFYFL
jgi:hypothetical protein